MEQPQFAHTRTWTILTEPEGIGCCSELDTFQAEAAAAIVKNRGGRVSGRGGVGKTKLMSFSKPSSKHSTTALISSQPHTYMQTSQEGKHSCQTSIATAGTSSSASSLTTYRRSPSRLGLTSRRQACRLHFRPTRRRRAVPTNRRRPPPMEATTTAERRDTRPHKRPPRPIAEVQAEAANQRRLRTSRLPPLRLCGKPLSTTRRR